MTTEQLRSLIENCLDGDDDYVAFNYELREDSDTGYIIDYDIDGVRFEDLCSEVDVHPADANETHVDALLTAFLSRYNVDDYYASRDEAAQVACREVEQTQPGGLAALFVVTDNSRVSPNAFVLEIGPGEMLPVQFWSIVSGPYLTTEEAEAKRDEYLNRITAQSLP